MSCPTRCWKSVCPRGFATCLSSGICNPRVDNCGYTIRTGHRPAVNHPVDCKSTGTGGQGINGNDDDNANY